MMVVEVKIFLGLDLFLGFDDDEFLIEQLCRKILVFYCLF